MLVVLYGTCVVTSTSGFPCVAFLGRHQFGFGCGGRASWRGLAGIPTPGTASANGFAVNDCRQDPLPNLAKAHWVLFRISLFPRLWL